MSGRCPVDVWSMSGSWIPCQGPCQGPTRGRPEPERVRVAEPIMGTGHWHFWAWSRYPPNLGYVSLQMDCDVLNCCILHVSEHGVYSVRIEEAIQIHTKKDRYIQKKLQYRPCIGPGNTWVRSSGEGWTSAFCPAQPARPCLLCQPQPSALRHSQPALQAALCYPGLRRRPDPALPAYLGPIL